MSANKDNPKFLSEVEIHKVVLNGNAPIISNLTKLESDDADVRITFLIIL